MKKIYIISLIAILVLFSGCVQDNSQQIEELQNEITDLKGEIAEKNEQITGLQERINELESAENPESIGQSGFSFTSVICDNINCGYNGSIFNEKCNGINTRDDLCILSEEWISSTELEIIGLTSATSGGGKIIGGKAVIIDDIINITVYIKKCEGICPTLAQNDLITLHFNNIIENEYSINTEIIKI